MNTEEMLRDSVTYDPETGVLTKGSKSNWCRQKHGHMLVRISGKTYKLHRLAWLCMTGSWPTNHIDHIDGDPTNNRWSNLRDVTRSQNLRNQRRSKKPTCGVYPVKGHWVVKVRVMGALVHYGSFADKAAAVAKAIQVRGERDADINGPLKMGVTAC